MNTVKRAGYTIWRKWRGVVCWRTVTQVCAVQERCVAKMQHKWALCRQVCVAKVQVTAKGVEESNTVAQLQNKEWHLIYIIVWRTKSFSDYMTCDEHSCDGEIERSLCMQGQPNRHYETWSRQGRLAVARQAASLTINAA